MINVHAYLNIHKREEMKKKMNQQPRIKVYNIHKVFYTINKLHCNLQQKKNLWKRNNENKRVIKDNLGEIIS